MYYYELPTGVQKACLALGTAIIGGVVGYVAGKKKRIKPDYDAYLEGFNDGAKVMDEEWRKVHKKCKIQFKFGGKKI